VDFPVRRRQLLQAGDLRLVLLSQRISTKWGARDQAAVKGALNSGLIVEDINSVLLYATANCGIPAGLDAFRTAHERWSSRSR